MCNCASAFSLRFSTISTTVPRWFSYAALGGPNSSMSSKPCRSLCTNVVRADASCESSMEEDTMILNACNKFVARCSCSESPESPESFESRSRMERARVKAPMTSTNSPSSTCNDADSFWRTDAALFKSASFFCHRCEKTLNCRCIGLDARRCTVDAGTQ